MVLWCLGWCLVATTALTSRRLQPAALTARRPLPLRQTVALAHDGVTQKDDVESVTQKEDAGDRDDGRDDELFYEEVKSHTTGSRPAPALVLGFKNFKAQGTSILEQALERAGFRAHDALRPPDCLGLTLSNEGVYARERKREASGGNVDDANGAARFLYDVGCAVLDRAFDERPLARFWFLEVIARIPYFSYVSMLHLYESLGWWRAPELRKVHGAEEWNELHHLLIMEALGGDSVWSDRFLAYHVAIVYYWALNALFLVSPREAYLFMELLEAHAVDTYGEFVDENSERLKQLPAPAVARSYYTTGDLYMFDDFQVDLPPGTRRPPCETLYDVFSNIEMDEAEHVKTMRACQDYARVGKAVISPHTRAEGKKPAGQSTTEVTEGDMAKRRESWKKWADSLAEEASKQKQT